MVSRIFKEIRELTCRKCGNVWIALKKHPKKCPSPQCQAQLKRFKPKVKITRIEIKTTKRILTL